MKYVIPIQIDDGSARALLGGDLPRTATLTRAALANAVALMIAEKIQTTATIVSAAKQTKQETSTTTAPETSDATESVSEKPKRTRKTKTIE